MGAIGSSVGGLFGIGNGDTNTFSPNTGGVNYGSALQNAGNQYNNAQYQQNQLTSQLQNQANGQGPNIAQQQLVTGTEQNTQQGAGLIAGQKGISPALAGRQIAQNTNNANQQMAGQGAQLRAQQQLSAQQQQAGIYGQQAGEANSNLGTYEAGLSGNNNVNANISSQNTGFNQQLAGGVVSGAGAALMAYQGGMVPQVSYNQRALATPMQVIPYSQGGMVYPQTSYQQQNLATPMQRIPGSQNIYPGGSPQQTSYRQQTLSTPMQVLSYADGGQVSPPPQQPISPQVLQAQSSMRKAFHFADGGAVDPMAQANAADTPTSFAANWMKGMQSAPGQQQATGGALAGKGMGAGVGAGIKSMFSNPNPMAGAQNLTPGSMGGAGGFAGADSSMVSPMSSMAAISPMMAAATGGKVPGRPMVKGDSPKNDVVPAVLSPGEVVIPNHVMQSSDPAGNAAKFVKAMMARKGMK